MTHQRRLLVAGLLASAVLLPGAARADEAPPAAPALEQQFRDPPNSARPRVWWHWLNGNVTKDGIAKDLDWMVQAGIGGLQNFDVDLGTPVRVRQRLAYMTPEWQDAFRFAASEADKRGLELAIAASPGWSETGGPWVQPKDALKKLVWSETPVKGGQRFSGKLAPLPETTGPFQDLPIFDPVAQLTGAPAKVPPRLNGQIAVYAVPAGPTALPTPQVNDGAGNPLDAKALTDASLTTALSLPRGPADAPTRIVYDYGQPVTVRSATLFSLGAKAMFVGAMLDPRLETSTDGKDWRAVAALPVMPVPTTIGFAPVTARYFRLTLNPLPIKAANMGNPAPGVVPPPFAQMMTGADKYPISLNQFVLSPEVRIDRFEAKAGFELEQDYYALGQPDGGAPALGQGQAIDLTGKVRPDGTLDWTPPRGDWKVVRLGWSLLGTTNHPAPAEATGLEVDKFDGMAVRGYLEHYLGMYRAATGPELMGQRGVRALLTDSIEVGAANWTPRMLDQFKRLRGYDPTPWLPALTGTLVGSRAQSDRFLYDYRRTLADLMASEHYGTVATVAREHGLKVYGEALEDHRPSLGDDMAMRRHADVPMAALWTWPKGSKPNPSYIADMKGAASVAHFYGQNIAAAESMTSAMTYWADSPQTLKRIIDTEFVTGINRPVVHTSVHSPDEVGQPGLSLMIFGQYFNRHESWAPLARAWVDYIARNSLMLQQGRNLADLAYFYGEEAPLTGLYGDHPVADAPVTSAYDFVNPDGLMALRNDGGEVVSPGGARYQAIYLGGSSRRMTLPVLRRLAELVEGGASVIGQRPVESPSLADDAAEWTALAAKLWDAPGGRLGQGRVIAASDAAAGLAALGVAPDFRFTGGQADSDLPFVHRKLADGDSYFIVNRHDRPERIEARFRVTGKAPELWRAETGTAEPLSYRIENGETVVPLLLAGEEAVHVVFRKAAATPALDLPAPALAAPIALDGPWTVRFQPGKGAPDSVVLPALQSLSDHADPRVRYYSGLATWSRSFTLPKGARPGQPLWLDLGAVGEIAQVRVNGKDVGTAWHKPFRLNIGAATVKGGNRIEVTVANLWVNRLIGDAQPGAVPNTWAAMPTYQADAPLRPSGLIGPVTLQAQGAVIPVNR